MTGHSMTQAAAWVVGCLTIGLILVRPWRLAEAWWACLGGCLMVAVGAVSLSTAEAAVGRSFHVLLFLAGMMMLAAVARHEGVFDVIAVAAVRTARGSATRLFNLVFLVGIGVTAFLSNDATAVVLTPAVIAAVKKTHSIPLPFLLICAFVANAAGFVLPISNPANLIVLGSDMPPLLRWLFEFSLPSLVAIGVTYGVLRLACRRSLAQPLAHDVDSVRLTRSGAAAAIAIGGSALILIACSALGLNLGVPTLAVGLASISLVAFLDRGLPVAVVRHVSWSVLPLVAGLFVTVSALADAGGAQMLSGMVGSATSHGPLAAGIGSAFGVGIASNVLNNLPVGLMASDLVAHGHYSTLVKDSLLIGVDLGPTLSVTGSLATILWLITLRREGLDISFGRFLRYGLMIMPPTLLLSIFALWLTVK